MESTHALREPQLAPRDSTREEPSGADRPIQRLARATGLRVLGALLVATGVGYIADSLAGLLLADHGGLVSAVLLTPAVLGEFGLTAWLLLRGVRVPRPATRQAG